MATFPMLKTGAVMQYPAPKRIQFRNQVIRFLDGAEQRYREYSAPIREWVVRLDLLDESELAAMEEFFVAQKGKYGSFTFIDPRDNVSYTDCSLADDELEVEVTGDLRGRTRLVIRENRS